VNTIRMVEYKKLWEKRADAHAAYNRAERGRSVAKYLFDRAVKKRHAGLIQFAGKMYYKRVMKVQRAKPFVDAVEREHEAELAHRARMRAGRAAAEANCSCKGGMCRKKWGPPAKSGGKSTYLGMASVCDAHKWMH